MHVEFLRAPLENHPEEQDRPISINPAYVVVVFESERIPNVCVVRIADCSRGFLVQGNYREVTAKLSEQGPPTS